MFNSVSACTPDSPVSTTFVSTRPQLLNISSNITVSIDGTVIAVRPIAIAVGEKVTATVTSPMGYLGYEFHEYYLNGTQQYFAVVNKNNYHPTVKPVDAAKKWFNYLPSNFLISFYYSTFDIQRPLGSAHGIVDIEKTHIVLDHVNDAVCFYTTNQTLATRVKLPAGPVEYRKLSYVDPDTNQLVTEAIVLCGNKRLYRIIFNNRYFNSDTFNPTVVQVVGLTGLWYEQDTPTGESYIDARRTYLRSKLNPVVTALDISSDTNNIWIAGYDSVFILNKNFQEINRVILTSETIISMACVGNDAIVTTRRGKAYYVTSTGTVTLIYQASALGNPCTIGSGTAVVLPDPDNQRLLRFNDASGTYTVIETPDINPAYPRIFQGVLWVTGYDSNQVLKITGADAVPVGYDNQTTIERLYFNDKVTLISVVDSSILATHYLQEFVTLDLTDIVKVIPFEVKSKTGPVSHIGTEPMLLKMLGQESIAPVAGPGLTCWVNGSYGQLANTGDYLGVSYKATGNGVFRRPFIVGETAFDYDVEASSSVLMTDFYKPGLVSTGITGNTTAETVPQTGNVQSGYTGPLELGFNWNMYGTTYSNISVSTNGSITFGNATPNFVRGFGNLNVDALYVETQSVYQRTPITNVDPLSVGYKTVATSQPMGVYYTSGVAGNFDYFKVRWVGVEADPYPDGKTTTVTASVVNTTSIPVANIGVASIGDYVSGNGITVSTRVTGSVDTPIYLANVLAKVANTNTLTLDTITAYNLPDIPEYAKVTNVSTGASTYLLSATNMRTGNFEISQFSGNTFYIDGTSASSINPLEYRAVLPTTTTTGILNYSVFFSSTDDKLAVANDSSNRLELGDWTVEAWIKLTSYSQDNMIFSKNGNPNVGGQAPWHFATASGTGRLYFMIEGTPFYYTDGPVVSQDKWHHVALVRYGTEIKMYLNGLFSGILVGVPYNFTSTGEFRIGHGRDGYGGGFNGYISNARLVKGVAVYTDNFTPPTAPLTAIPGTSLLTCQSPTIVDTGPNNFNIGVYGIVFVSPDSPFTIVTRANVSTEITSVSQTAITTPYVIISSSRELNITVLQVSQEFYENSFINRQAVAFPDNGLNYSVFLLNRGITISPYLAVSYNGKPIGERGTLSIDATEIVANVDLANVNRPVYATSPRTKVVFEKVQMDVVDSSVIDKGQIQIQAKLVKVSPSVTVGTDTEVLFKTELPTPKEYTYEVAFYVGRTYQFLEFYYKNSNHSATSTVGISSSDYTVLSTPITASPNTSAVFFSPANSGNWSYLGPGKTDPVAKIFSPRFPVIANSQADMPNQSRIEFVIDQTFPATANVLLSTTFGYLTVNDGIYSGKSFIRENDTISLTVPFNTSLSTVVPLISIGDYQFAIPMQSVAAPSSYIEITNFYPEQATEEYVATPIVIPVSDSYYVPEYYRVSGNAFVFTRTPVEGTETVIEAGQTYDFNAGETVTVYNQLTSTSLYDRREVVMASPSFVVRTTWETAPGELFDYMDFGTLVEPYVDNYEYTFSSYLGNNVVAIDPEIYATANITLTANTAITGNLYIDMYSSNLVTNGNVAGTYVTNVSTGTDIALQRKLIHYFQDDVIVYQVKYDTAIGSNVYIPRGIWNINHKIISGAVKEKTNSVVTNSIDVQETEYSYSVLNGNKLQARFHQEAVSDTDGISVDSLPFDGTYIQFGNVTADATPSISTYALTGHVAGGILPSTYINLGSISSKYIGLSSYFNPTKMPAVNADIYSYILHNLTQSPDAIQFTAIRLGPLVPVNSDRYAMLMLGGVTNVWDPGSLVMAGNLSIAINNTERTLIEIDISSKAYYGYDVLADAAASNVEVTISSPLTDLLYSKQAEDTSYITTPWQFVDDVNSSYALQNDKFEAVFDTFGISWSLYGFDQIGETVSSYFTANAETQFIKTYSYVDQIKIQSDSIKNASYIINDQMDFVNRDELTYFGTEVSSEYVGLYTILGNLTLTEQYQGSGTLLEPVKLQPQDMGLYTIITQPKFLGRAERKENLILQSITVVDTHVVTSELTSNISVEQDIEPIYTVGTFSPVQDIEPEYLVNLLPVQDIEPEYLVDLLPVQDIEPEYLVNLLPVQDIEPEYLVNLLPIQDIEPEYLVGLTPVQDIEPEYLVGLTPVQDIEPEYLVNLLPVQDIEPKILVPLPAVLDADILWTMDPFTNVGAYKTYIHMWADQGRGGDLASSMGTPPNFGPLLPYTKEYNYSYGGRLLSQQEAVEQKVKYYSASALNIATTDYWNYRIFFNNRHFCVPRKGRLFPVTWYIRGG